MLFSISNFNVQWREGPGSDPVRPEAAESVAHLSLDHYIRQPWLQGPGNKLPMFLSPWESIAWGSGWETLLLHLEVDVLTCPKYIWDCNFHVRCVSSFRFEMVWSCLYKAMESINLLFKGLGQAYSWNFYSLVWQVCKNVRKVILVQSNTQQWS